MSFRLGWLDYQRGSGWSADYETWSPQKQLQYERGRRAAALAKGNGTHAAPSWAVYQQSLGKAARYAALKEVGVK